MPKILIVSELWCDGNPAKGITNNIHNLVGSFKNSGCGECETLFLDQCAYQEQKHIDVKIQEELGNIKPDAVICSLLGFSQLNPSVDILRYIKSKHIKIVLVWPDLIFDWSQLFLQKLDSITDLHLTYDKYGEGLEHLSKKIKFFGVPQDERLYFPEANKQYDISFLGSTDNRPVRQKYLEILQQKFSRYRLYIGGGQREQNVTAEKYAAITRQSKIVLNFADSPNRVMQCKGRIFEVLACGNVLAELQNDQTSDLLSHKDNCIMFWDEESFINNLQEVISDDATMSKIASSAYSLYTKFYSNKKYWSQVLEEIFQR